MDTCNVLYQETCRTQDSEEMSISSTSLGVRGIGEGHTHP